MAQESKREILKDKVVKLVRDFMVKEGGINSYDLEALFGSISPVIDNEVAAALAILPIVV